MRPWRTNARAKGHNQMNLLNAKKDIRAASRKKRGDASKGSTRGPDQRQNFASVFKRNQNVSQEKSSFMPWATSADT